MNTYGFDSVICFGGEDWWYHNRGHVDMQLMRRFARIAATLYVNSIVMQKPTLSEGKKLVQKLTRKTKSIFRGLQKSNAGFWVYSPFSLPLHHITCLRLLNKKILYGQLSLVRQRFGMHHPVIWVACPAACDVAIKMKKTKLVYQRTDRLEEFPNMDRQTVKHYDKSLKTAADLTIFVNRNLYEEEHHECKKAFYLDHGVDFELFTKAMKTPTRPDDITHIPEPIIGFFGSFGEHITDIALLEKVVELLPNMSFVFVGQSTQGCARLGARKNVWMLGQKPYEEIPHYGKCFDVAIMPWLQNQWIEACNPIKLKEYLALGKPVVSTPFPELQKYSDVVYQATAPDQFAEYILKALSEDNLKRVILRTRKVQTASWDGKAKLVLDELFKKT